MKIAIVSDRVYPYFKGGAEKRYWEIATRLVKKGHEVHFYTGQWPGMAKDEVVEGVHLHGVYTVGQFYVNGRKSITESIKYTLALFIPLLRADYDVMDCESVPLLSLYPARLACWLKRKKLVTTWHEAWGKDYWKEYVGWKWVLAAPIERIAAKLPDKIIAISPHTKRQLHDKLGVPLKRMVVIEFGSDTEHIKQVKASNVKSDLIYAGRLIEHKNVDALIRATAELQKHGKVKCIIVGDGPEKRRLERIAKQLKANVKFTGFMERHEDVYALMKSSRVFVLPSKREGYGIVVAEANGCGIPVVTIDAPDNAAKELIVDGKNGQVCKLNNLHIGISKALRLKRVSASHKSWNQVASRMEQEYA